jgi:hypothetical protein
MVTKSVVYRLIIQINFILLSAGIQLFTFKKKILREDFLPKRINKKKEKDGKRIRSNSNKRIKKMFYKERIY